MRNRNRDNSDEETRMSGKQQGSMKTTGYLRNCNRDNSDEKNQVSGKTSVP